MKYTHLELSNLIGQFERTMVPIYTRLHHNDGGWYGTCTIERRRPEDSVNPVATEQVVQPACTPWL